MSDRTCGARVRMSAAQMARARRFHQPYAGELSPWAVCAKPAHNRDRPHVALLWSVPDDQGGGYVLLTWGRYWRYCTAGGDVARAAFFHWPPKRRMPSDRGEEAHG